MGAALLDFQFRRNQGRPRRCESPYDSAFFLTIFKVPRRLGLDKEAADGMVSGTW